MTELMMRLKNDPSFQQGTKIASQIILDAVTLPEGTIQAGRESDVRKAYQTLMLSHQLDRAGTYLHLASLTPSITTAKCLNFYARQELLPIHAWITEIEPIGGFAEAITNVLATLTTDLLEPDNIHLTKSSLSGNHLVLVSDLYRDFDDWLTLLHVIISGKYEKITILTSNEVAGEYAKTTESFIPSLIALAKVLHDKDFDIQVFQGLPAFDFAALHSEHQGQFLKQYEDLLQILPSWKGLQTDVVSIGKVADLNILSQLAKSQGITFNQLTVLGCKPDSVSTNTNGPAYHLQSLPHGTTMLDSRYGKEPEFDINKANFEDLFNVSLEDLADAITLSIHSNTHNTLEVYFKEMLLKLAQLSQDKSLSSHEKKSLLVLVNTSLEHLSHLNYPRGNTFDLFTLLAGQVPAKSQIIYFMIQPEALDKAKCLSTRPHATAETVVHSVEVSYPDKTTLNKNFLNYLKVLIDPLLQRIEKNKMIPNSPILTISTQASSAFGLFESSKLKKENMTCSQNSNMNTKI